MTYEITQADLMFKNDVESCRFPIPNFDHRAHLRLAYIYLVQTNSPSQSVKLVRQALVGLLKKAGVDPSVKYHETLTEAWLLAVHHFMHHTSHASSADDFIDQNPRLLDSKVMYTHYSEDVLFSAAAKTTFIEPEAFTMNLFFSKTRQISAQKRSLLNVNDDLSTDLTLCLGKRGLLQRPQPDLEPIPRYAS